MSAVGLVAACDDPHLFGFKFWPKQRELLAAIEAGPRLAVWALGRRAGKSTLAALVGLHSCLFRPDLDAMVRPGERRYAVANATRIEQARLGSGRARVPPRAVMSPPPAVAVQRSGASTCVAREAEPEPDFA